MTELTERIRREWQSFAQTKVYAFRGISPAAYELWAPDYFRAILDRSQIHTTEDKGELIACLVTERIAGTESTIVHWAWTARAHRNTAVQHLLWMHSGLDPYKSKIFISHLTVLVEELITDKPGKPAKYGWLFSPFSLYKGYKDEIRKVEAEAGDGHAGEHR